MQGEFFLVLIIIVVNKLKLHLNCRECRKITENKNVELTFQYVWQFSNLAELKNVSTFHSNKNISINKLYKLNTKKSLDIK